MTLQNGNLRRAVTGVLGSGAVAIGLLGGLGVAPAFAEPGQSCTGAECAKNDPAAASAPTDGAAPAMTADQALAIIAQDYDTGAGGGQLSQLIHSVLKLRAQGFKPSNANKDAITKALDYRPNQAPLIEALKDTLAYQRKMQALQQNSNNPSQPGYNFGIGQAPPGMGPAVPPGVPVEPGGTPGAFIGVG
ncbi:hypothetical protein [Mycobacterium sp. 3519A]|jgi:hypothetical protein|uniref:hypothetical protein n=1 Tax=Mycobacterium sp. 3519A TaxID=2057184 RepID=UPI000C7AAA05|nr:hypothetical protein [Mycobacterium sp. 3519A]